MHKKSSNHFQTVNIKYHFITNYGKNVDRLEVLHGIDGTDFNEPNFHLWFADKQIITLKDCIMYDEWTHEQIKENFDDVRKINISTEIIAIYL